MFNKVGLKEWEGKVFIIQPLSLLRKLGAARDGESLPWLLPPMLMITIIPFLLPRWRGSSGYRSRNFSLLQESPCSVKWFADLKRARRQMELVPNIYHPQQSRDWFNWYGWLGGHPCKYYLSLLELCENREVYSHAKDDEWPSGQGSVELYSSSKDSEQGSKDKSLIITKWSTLRH